ncbi:uncharacterized protein (TIGR02646 family) [Pseudomonas lini]|uniref:hypothetical protein n=1 Tax=Pseudomonas lini TaxID=163011 RepID=UPI00278A42A7|nr:hypothetical protein [Pseudomonas lini]MDQ0124392.1 uncharacterized protein (TIGR02646 family) [Pseudomonas lini]
MRWICKDDIEERLTERWRLAASNARATLDIAVTNEEKKAVLKLSSSSKVWRDFYELLPEHLKKKCWYCESEEIRSDMPVDHFRPKGKIEGEQGHNGYWWLSFDWKNYRCACTFCNSLRNFEESTGGKGCKFPLINPSNRAFIPGAEVLEEPNFLDPLDPEDWKLLWFDNDGKPMLNPSSELANNEKVQNTIDIFHLHESKIVRKRNQVRLNIEKHINKLKKALTERDSESIQEAKISLRKMVRDTEMLSRAAIVFMRQHRDLPEIKEILQID